MTNNKPRNNYLLAFSAAPSFFIAFIVSNWKYKSDGKYDNTACGVFKGGIQN